MQSIPSIDAAMENQFLSFPLLFTFFLIILSVLRIWKKSMSKTSTPNLPPGPRKLPLIGSLHHVTGSLPHHRLRELAKKYGPIMLLQLGEFNNIVISSPETAKEVMKTHDLIFCQRPLIISTNLLSYNSTDIAFAPYGDYWRMLRKICTSELLTANRVQFFRSIREEEAAKFVACVSSFAGSPINFSRKINTLTYSIITRAAFGKVWNGEEVFVPCIKNLAEAVAGFDLADLYPSIKLLPVITGLKSRLWKLHRGVDEIFQSIIDEHRRKRAASNTGADQNKEEEDLVDVLLNLQEGGDLDLPLTTENIKAVILDVFIAGSDTSSTPVEWAMSEMLKNPGVMEKAQAEVRRVFEAKGTVDEAGLHELKYLKSIIKETLRLHPPVPLLVPRECRENCVINGYNIPEKTRIMVNAWAIGRDPNYWTDPERFYPERFLDSTVDYKGTSFEFIPFGAGRRMCPGMLFGIANVELPLAQLLYHFDWVLPNGLKPENLDMSETLSITVKRKNELYVIPVPYRPALVKS